MTDYVVGGSDEIRDGERMVVQLEGREIAVFSIDGEYHAYTNWCAHQSGPICEGMLTGTTIASFDKETLETELAWDDEGRILTCPWHAWEYDVTTGECLSRENIRLIEHDVREEDGEIVVSM